ncbi:glutathione hydrolase 1 proenzyme-like [Glandiceps talaboti]
MLGLLAVAVAIYMSRNQTIVEDLERLMNSNESSSVAACFPKAAVSADHRICSEYGSLILQKGGNAVDAAITAMLCTGVVNGHSVSIAGSHYMVIYNKQKNIVEAIEARVEAPKAANESMFQNTSAFEGALTIAIPGDISGFWLAHQRHGKLPWRDLFQPAIELASRGVPLSPATAMAIQTYRVQHKLLPKSQSLRHLLTKPDDSLYNEGDLLFRPKYAKTLQLMSEGSDRTFYEGPLAQDIVADITEEGGIITLDDLKNYKALLKKPIESTFGNYTLYTAPPTSGAVILALILNILKGYNIRTDDLTNRNETLLWNHRVIEAFKMAYTYHEKIGDDKFIEMEKLIERLTSDQLASYLRSRIDDNQTHDPEYYGESLYAPEDGGTSHVSVIDHFGSGVYGSRTGIIFNNEMSNFDRSQRPTSQNKIQPGKRPMSSMSPVIILDENRDVKMALGSAGGVRIISTNVLIILEALMFGRDIRSAVIKPRFNYNRIANLINHEPQLDSDLIEGLNKTFGHSVHTDLIQIYSVVMAVLRENSGLCAYPDHRKPGGFPAGF